MRVLVRGRVAVFVLAAALCAVLAPAANAQSPAPGSQCSHTDAMCIGFGKLAERTSAECRRAADGVPGRPVSDPQCQAPAGRSVDRAGLVAHGASWIHRALAFQYALGNEVPFRDAPWIGTHNSFNSTSEFPTLSHTDSNQQLSLVDQLGLDVRSLEVDVHWSPTPRSGADGAQTQGRAPVVCHAQEQQGVHVGCTSERLLGDVLAGVAGWLNRPENRDQVILLYLEDHLEGNHAAARAVLERTLKRDGGLDGSLIYRAGASDSDCRSLPLALTRRQVLDSGAQVVIVSGCGNGWDSRVFAWGEDVRVEDRPHGYTAANCGGVSRETYASHLVRFYEDSTFLTPASAQASQGQIATADDGIDPATAAAMVRCGVDLFGLDQLVPGDARLASLAWSWAPDKPAASDGGCALQRADSRWVTGDCAQARPAACRRPDGRWTVSAAGAYDLAEAACAGAGGQFDLPRTGYDNAQLRAAAGTGEVWVHHRAFAASGVKQGAGGGSGTEVSGAPVPAATSTPASRPVSHAAAARCRLLPGSTRPSRGRMVCRIRLAPGAAAVATLRLTRGGGTYALATRLLRRGGGTIDLRSARPLRRGVYALTLKFAGETRTQLRQRLRVR
jgi:hypothetical protein